MVVDQGPDGGLDDIIGRPAVDVVDERLRVKTRAGHVVYDSQTDDFHAFYRRMRRIWRGEVVTITRQESADPTAPIVTTEFAAGALHRSTATMTQRHADPRALLVDQYYYRSGAISEQTVLNCPTQDAASPTTPAVCAHDPHRAEITINLLSQATYLRFWKTSETDPPLSDQLRTVLARTFPEEPNTPHAIHFVQDDRTTQLQAFITEAAAHDAFTTLRSRGDATTLRPVGDEYHGRAHGVPFVILSEPQWEGNNVVHVPAIAVAFQVIPPRVLQLLQHVQRTQYKRNHFIIQCLDLGRYRDAPEVLRARLPRLALYPLGWSLLGGALLLLSEPITPLASRNALALYARQPTHNGQLDASYNRSDGRVRVLKQPPGREIIVHEIGHMIEQMLGPDFARELETSFRTYMAEAMTAVGATAEERASVESLWQTEHPAAPLYKNNTALQRMVEAQWLNRPYAGIAAREFFAELVAMALTGRDPNQQVVPDGAHYARHIRAVRHALTTGRTPEEIRQLWREKLATP